MAYEPNKTDLVSNKTGETLSKFTDYLEKQHKNNFNTDETRKIIRDVFWILFEDKDNIQSQDVKDFSSLFFSKESSGLLLKNSKLQSLHLYNIKDFPLLTFFILEIVVLEQILQFIF